MKKIYFILFSFMILIFSLTSAYATPITYNFSYLGVAYGTMTISAFDADTLQVRFDAASSIPGSGRSDRFRVHVCSEYNPAKFCNKSR